MEQSQDSTAKRKLADTDSDPMSEMKRVKTDERYLVQLWTCPASMHVSDIEQCFPNAVHVELRKVKPNKRRAACTRVAFVEFTTMEEAEEVAEGQVMEIGDIVVTLKYVGSRAEYVKRGEKSWLIAMGSVEDQTTGGQPKIREDTSGAVHGGTSYDVKHHNAGSKDEVAFQPENSLVVSPVPAVSEHQLQRACNNSVQLRIPRGPDRIDMGYAYLEFTSPEKATEVWLRHHHGLLIVNKRTYMHVYRSVQDMTNKQHPAELLILNLADNLPLGYMAVMFPTATGITMGLDSREKRYCCVTFSSPADLRAAASSEKAKTLVETGASFTYLPELYDVEEQEAKREPILVMRNLPRNTGRKQLCKQPALQNHRKRIKCIPQQCVALIQLNDTSEAVKIMDQLQEIDGVRPVFELRHDTILNCMSSFSESEAMQMKGQQSVKRESGIPRSPRANDSPTKPADPPKPAVPFEYTVEVQYSAADITSKEIARCLGVAPHQVSILPNQCMALVGFRYEKAAVSKATRFQEGTLGKKVASKNELQLTYRKGASMNEQSQIVDQGQGQSNEGQCQSNEGQGQYNEGQGQSNEGQGQSNEGQCQSVEGQCQSVEGPGQSGEGQGQSGEAPTKVFRFAHIVEARYAAIDIRRWQIAKRLDVYIQQVQMTPDTSTALVGFRAESAAISQIQRVQAGTYAQRTSCPDLHLTYRYKNTDECLSAVLVSNDATDDERDNKHTVNTHTVIVGNLPDRLMKTDITAYLRTGFKRPIELRNGFLYVGYSNYATANGSFKRFEKRIKLDLESGASGQACPLNVVELGRVTVEYKQECIWDVLKPETTTQIDPPLDTMWDNYERENPNTESNVDQSSLNVDRSLTEADGAGIANPDYVTPSPIGDVYYPSGGGLIDRDQSSLAQANRQPDVSDNHHPSHVVDVSGDYHASHVVDVSGDYHASHVVDDVYSSGAMATDATTAQNVSLTGENIQPNANQDYNSSVGDRVKFGVIFSDTKVKQSSLTGDNDHDTVM